MKMAITKIWNIPKSRRGNLSDSLKRSLLYIVNPEKTDDGLLVGAVNCIPDAMLAYEQMCETKRMFGKELGRQGYHIVISCPIAEGDPQTMYQLTQEFIEHFLGERYEALFAVHMDKEHLHSHIVYNSCNMIDGYKYQYKKGDWKDIIQPITNSLCDKYGWSIMPAEYSKEPQRMSRKEYEYQKSMKDVILADVEYCMSKAECMDEFIWNLEQLGYQVKRGKHLAVRMDGMSRYRRLDTLDGSLSVQNIEETFEELRGMDVSVVVLSQTPEPIKAYEPEVESSLRKKLYDKMVRLHQLETSRFYNHAARHYQDIKRLHEIHAQYMYLVEHKIRTMDDYCRDLKRVQDRMDTITEEQKVIYKENRKLNATIRNHPENLKESQEKLEANHERLAQLKAEKKQLYKDKEMQFDIISESYYRAVVKPAFDDINKPSVPESPWKKARREKEEQIKREEARRLEEEKRRAEREAWEKKRALEEQRKKEEQERLAKEQEIHQAQQLAEQKKRDALEQKAQEMADALVEYGCHKDTILSMPDDIIALFVGSPNVSQMEFEETFARALQIMGVVADNDELYVKACAVYRENVNASEKEELGKELPDSFQEFMKLSPETQAELLCSDIESLEHVPELLQMFAESSGHQFSYASELFDVAYPIEQAARKQFVEREVKPIVQELKIAGVTANNFDRLQVDSIAPLFSYLSGNQDILQKVFFEVHRQLGVKPNFERDSRMLAQLGECTEERETRSRKGR